MSKSNSQDPFKSNGQGNYFHPLNNVPIEGLPSECTSIDQKYFPQIKEVANKFSTIIVCGEDVSGASHICEAYVQTQAHSSKVLYIYI